MPCLRLEKQSLGELSKHKNKTNSRKTKSNIQKDKNRDGIIQYPSGTSNHVALMMEVLYIDLMQLMI